MSHSQRVFVRSDPYPARPWVAWVEPWRAHGWPCGWIGCPAAGEAPFAAGFRCRFDLDDAAQFLAHVSADERYELFLDGQRVGRGNGGGGDSRHWSYETYEFILKPGEHILAARVWVLGPFARLAQMHARPGFLFSPAGEPWIGRLGSGVARWEATRLDGYRFIAPPPSMQGVGAFFAVDGGCFPWGWETGGGTGWQPVALLEIADDATGNSGATPLHRLESATLPPMRDEPWPRGLVRLVGDAGPRTVWPDGETPPDLPPVRLDLASHLAAEAESWTRLLAGCGPVTVPAGTARRVIFDLEDYACAFVEMTLTGGRGGSVRLRWAEAVYEDATLSRKGPRDELDGRYFAGPADWFLPDGGAGRSYETPAWRCGRFLEIVVVTEDEPLVIERWTLRETRYPLEMASTFAASDARLARLTPVLLRGLQACAHDTYVDCPYYEQLQYVGDSALQALTGAQISRDDRLWRRYLQMVDASRPGGGFTPSRYPSRGAQSIPSFSLCWIGSLHDYAQWRGDAGFVRTLLPGARALLDLWLARRNADGLIVSPPGWNFVDWAPGPPHWSWGVPRGGESGGISAVLNWHVVWTLRRVAELETWLDEPELAARWRRLAAALADVATPVFWDEAHGGFADDPRRTRHSDHAQCLAILSGTLDADRRERTGAALLSAPEGEMRTSVYFAHYWFETCRALGRMDAALARMDEWFGMAKMGLRTTPENSDLRATRSDCHAWSATPLFHFFASILGVRPGAPGYGRVEITPQLGPLMWARGTAIHPGGDIVVDVRRGHDDASVLSARVQLPEGLTGEFVSGGQRFALRGGTQEIRCG